MSQIIRIHTGGRPAIRDEYGNKRCPHCGVWKPANATHFAIFVRYADGQHCFSSWCRACTRDYARGYMQQKRKAVPA